MSLYNNQFIFSLKFSITNNQNLQNVMFIALQLHYLYMTIFIFDEKAYEILFSLFLK